MARASKKLSAIQVKAVTKTGRHGDGDGLYLNVAAGGSKSWVFLWMKEGRRREMGLGASQQLVLPMLARKQKTVAGSLRQVAIL